jgi:peptidyl-dipeptidase A
VSPNWHLILLLPAVLPVLAACAGNAPPAEDAAFRAEIDGFLARLNADYVAHFRGAAEAEWAQNTRIVEGDESNARRTRAAREAMARWLGDPALTGRMRAALERRQALTPLQVRQLETALYEAANSPGEARELVDRRIAVETAQTEKLFGFAFRLDGREVSTNELDEILKSETDPARRRRAYEASKEVGAGLREGLRELQALRNATVRPLGYPDFFTYQVSEYDMSREEMLALCDRLVLELRPLYTELHTWARHELARRYGAPVPDLIPAHWLPNRWAQDWTALVQVPGFDLDSALRSKPPAYCIEQAERFYTSLGFPALPASFHERSSLYPVPPGSGYRKNNHASAWHIDLDQDVRCLMSVESNAEWFETTHHELGHIHYYLAYSRPEVPPLLRRGANRAFHEAVGSLLGLAAMQPRFAEAIGLLRIETRPDPVQTLLKEALNFVVFIPWSAGVMTRFEHDLYAGNLEPAAWNDRWWELVARYQGVAPPGPRDPGSCDAATKTHINDDAGQYYDYALSFVILFQLHHHIATTILREDPRDTNYYGREEIGRFLRRILEPGATRDWRELLREVTGQGISAEPMLSYFAPLQDWLRRENAGRRATLPAL